MMGEEGLGSFLLIIRGLFAASFFLGGILRRLHIPLLVAALYVREPFTCDLYTPYRLF
jgi:hypothetical protein